MPQSVDPNIPPYIKAMIVQWLEEDPSRSAADLARLTGLTEGQISKIRNHGSRVGWKAATELGKVFGHRHLGDVQEAARRWVESNPGDAPRSRQLSRVPHPRLRDRKEWPDVVRQAAALRDEVDEEAFKETGELWDSDVYPHPLNAKFVGNIAYAFFADRAHRKQRQVVK